MTVCLFKIVTGIPCPGCGMLRAHASLICKDVRGAFFWHPLFALPPLALVVFLGRNITAGTGDRRLSRQSSVDRGLQLLGKTSLVAFLCLWIVRLRFRIPGVASRDDLR